ncbi:MAG TPA: molybdopterin converting factor subunit 1 [Oceanospirillales bacterium]|nr:molybdopterin converting factor subunit 1 [Oleispira sp.]HCM05476.1 molybdopterin converting factor subunit 1 [Oceanospirillales bacterium]|tara:strand:+ start:288 stop:530 length:243 start_codon:yes stop_codon:yes gene_type:complete
MINVLFFARLKDQIGQADIQLENNVAGKTVAEIQQQLIEQGMTALQDDSIRIALNQTFCSGDAVIKAGDEVAFMPPVTGG